MSNLFSAHWGVDWIWSIPLLIFTVLVHSFVLRLANQGVHTLQNVSTGKHWRPLIAIVGVGAPALCAIMAHGMEAWLWSLAYFFSGAISDPKTAMEFSLGAMTTFSDNGIHLQAGWRLMGPLEALDGWILFGLTTAFLFTIIREVWSTDRWV